MFALLDLSEDSRGLSLKCDPELAIELREQHPEVTPAWHFNKQPLSQSIFFQQLISYLFSLFLRSKADMTPSGMKKNKPSYNLILLLLPAVLWLFINTTVNSHIHILADGYVITHSHPFVEKQANSIPSKTHHHTKKELLLLSLFSGLVFSIISLLIIRPFLCAFPQLLRIRVAHQEPTRNHFQVHHYHAPPFSV